LLASSALDDKFENHVADTLAAGAGLCDREVVEMVVREAPEHIRSSVPGAPRSTVSTARSLLGREGGHSHNRIVHALGDATGQEIMRAMIARARDVHTAQIWQNTFTIDLLTQRRSLPRRARLERTPRQDLRLGQANDPRHRRRGADLSRNDQPAGRHRRRPRRGLPRRRRTRRHGVHAVPPHGPLHRRQQPQPHQRSGPRRRRHPGERAIGHRFMPDYDPRSRARPARRRQPGHRRPNGKDKHSCVYLDLSHLDAETIRRPLPGIGSVCAASSASTSPSTASRSAPAPTT
jgi:L-aspartate oxidase